MANSHPGSYCGQDAYNDMFVVEKMNESKLGWHTDLANIDLEKCGGGQRMPDKDNFNCVISEEPEYAKTRSKVLCILQETYGEKKVLQWGAAIMDRLQQAEILRQGVHEESIQRKAKEWDKLDGGSLPCEELVATWIVRDMWEQQKCGCSPQGFKPTKQRYFKSPKIMPELPHEDTSSAQGLFDMWSKGKGIWLLQQALHQIQEIRKSKNSEWKGGDGMNGVKTVVRRLTPL